MGLKCHSFPSFQGHTNGYRDVYCVLKILTRKTLIPDKDIVTLHLLTLLWRMTVSQRSLYCSTSLYCLYINKSTPLSMYAFRDRFIYILVTPVLVGYTSGKVLFGSCYTVHYGMDTKNLIPLSLDLLYFMSMQIYKNISLSTKIENIFSNHLITAHSVPECGIEWPRLSLCPKKKNLTVKW